MSPPKTSWAAPVAIVLLWGVATSLGWLLGQYVLLKLFLLYAGPSELKSWAEAAALALIFVPNGFWLGLTVAVCQGIAAHYTVGQARRWAVATFAAYAIGLPAGLFLAVAISWAFATAFGTRVFAPPPTYNVYVPIMPTMLYTGLVVGMIQAWSVHFTGFAQRRGQVLWVGSTMLAWVLAIIVVGNLFGTPLGQNLWLQNAVSGAIIGLVNGGTLVLLAHAARAKILKSTSTSPNSR